jgi:Glycosyltransferase sugar-binding region containing DXD motif
MLSIKNAKQATLKRRSTVLSLPPPLIVFPVWRLALLYKFGGWYADIDTIIMKPLTDFDNKFGFKEDNLISTDQGQML